jgi:hypothetical protein
MNAQIRGNIHGQRPRMGLSMDEWDADGAALKAFTASIPKDFAAAQKQILTTLFLCRQGQDRPVSEPHAELAAIAGLELSAYFTGLLKLKFAGFVTDDGKGLRINRVAIRRAKAANSDEKPRRASGGSS